VPLLTAIKEGPELPLDSIIYYLTTDFIDGNSMSNEKIKVRDVVALISIEKLGIFNF
jgi:hypothetical protein